MMSGGSMIGLSAALVMWGVFALIFFLLVRLAVDKSNMRTELRHLRREVRELKALVQNNRSDSVNRNEDFTYNPPEDN